MSRSPAKKPPAWPEAGVLLAVLVLLAAVGGGLGLMQAVAFAGAVAGVLVLGWLWKLTLQRAASAAELTRGQRVWNLAILVVVLAGLAWVAWWCAENAEERAHPAATHAVDEQPGDDVPNE
jgi:hypothetical protein